MPGFLRDTKMRVGVQVNSDQVEKASQKVTYLSEHLRKSSSNADALSRSFDRASTKLTKTTSATQKLLNKFDGLSKTKANKTLADLDMKMQDVESQSRASTAGLSEMGRGQEKLKLKIEATNKLISLQRDRLAILEREHAKMRTSQNKSADAANNLKVRINEEKAALGHLEGTLSKAKKGYDDLTKSTNNAIDSQKRLSKLDGIHNKTKGLGQNLTDAGSGMVNTLGIGTYALGGGVVYATKKAMDFQSQMSSVKSVMDPDDVNKYGKTLENLAIKQGSETKYSATEAAQAEEELAKAGVSVRDIMNGALAGSLNLATAGELNLKDAAEVASTALNAFKSDNISVSKAADILAGAANASATDVSELKYGLSAVSSVASGVGLSFKDTSTALAVFAQNGLKGQDAGTSLKTMLLNLSPHTKDAADMMASLNLGTTNATAGFNYLVSKGITPVNKTTDAVADSLMKLAKQQAGNGASATKVAKEYVNLAKMSGFASSAFYDQNGHLKSMSEIAGILQNSLKGLNDEQRQNALETMFGSDAIRAGNILYKEGSKGIEGMAKSMDKIKAADVAKQKMDNFKGTVEQLKGSVETAGITFGNALTPALDKTAKFIQHGVDGFNHLSPAMQHTIAIGAGVSTVLLGIGVAVGGLLLVAGGAIRGVSAITGVMGKLKRTSKTSGMTQYRSELSRTGSQAMTTAEEIQLAAKMMQESARQMQSAANAMNSVDFDGNLGKKGKKGKTKRSTDDVETVEEVEDVVSGSGNNKKSKVTKKRRGFFRRKGASSIIEGGEELAENASKGGKFLRGVGKVGKVVGGGVVGLDVLTSATSLIGMHKNNAGEKIGDFGGTLAGGAAGAAIGSLIAPGVGTLIGGGIGAFAGGAFGKKFGNSVDGYFKKKSKDLLPKTIDFGKGVSKTTSTALKSYQVLSNKATEKINELYWSGQKLKKQDADTLSKPYRQMAKKIVDGYDSSFKKGKDVLSAGTTLSKKEQSKILKDTKSKNDAKKKDVQKTEREIESILKTSIQKHGKITSAAQQKVNELSKKMNKSSVTALSKSQAEQKIIYGKMRDNASKLTARQAADTIKNSRKAYLTTKKNAEKEYVSSKENAEKKYNSVKKWAEDQYYVKHNLSKEEYEKVIKNAKKERDDTESAAREKKEKAVKQASEMHQKVVSQATKQAGEHADAINTETGDVLSKWDQMKIGIFKTINSISSVLNKALKFMGWDKQIPMISIPSTGAKSKSSKKMHAHAKGTSATTAGPKLVGEEGIELAYHPQKGYAQLLGQNGAEVVHMESGMKILSHAKTRKVLNGGLGVGEVMPGYASGNSTIGEFASSVWNKAKKTTSNIVEKASDIYSSVKNKTVSSTKNVAQTVKDYVSDTYKSASKKVSNIKNAVVDKVSDVADWIIHPIKNTKKLFSKYLPLKNDVADLGTATLTFARDKVGNFISNKAANFGGLGGKAAGSKQVQAWILTAMKATNTPAAYLPALTQLAMKESGGNPRAVNLWDSNAKAGHPSKGLMQTIDSTFKAHAMKGHKDIWNPVDNAIAAIRYANARYGSIGNIPGIRAMAQGKGYVGYKKGGLINKAHLAMVGEDNKKEVAIPLERYKDRAVKLWEMAGNALGLLKSPLENDDSFTGELPDTSSHVKQPKQNKKDGIHINFSPTININIDGSKSDTTEAKVNRAVKEALEQAFKDLRGLFDTGVAY